MTGVMEAFGQWEGAFLLFLQDVVRMPALTWLLTKITALGDAGWFWIFLTILFLVGKKYRVTGQVMALALLTDVLVVNLALKNIDQQIIQSVLQLQQLYFSPIQENEPILLPKKHSIRDSSKDIMALAREMQKISRSNPYIAGIDLYYEATNTVVTNFNKIHFPADKQQINRYLPWYKSYQDIYRENKQNPVWTTQKVYLEKEPLLLYINRISGLNQSNDDDIILCAYLKPESFSDYIDQSAGNLFITAGNNQLLYSSDAWEDFSLPDPKASPGIQEIDDFMVSLVSSPTSGLNYYYAMDSTGFYRDYTSVSHILLFSFFLSIVFNVVILLVINLYNHST